jgi:hypothetical protein
MQVEPVKDVGDLDDRVEHGVGYFEKSFRLYLLRRETHR